MVPDCRKEKEKQFFNKAFELGSRTSVSRFYEISDSSKAYENLILSDCRDQVVLEYGCGKGSYAFHLAKCGAEVVGIDISEVAVRLAKTQAEKEKLKSITFQVMDAESTHFQENTFDKICGTGILHHLNFNKALKEITRILRPEGKAIFKEPLGHNPFINIFRRLTPQLRTEDEHPLKNKDIKQIDKFFYDYDYQFFYFLSFIALSFRNVRLFSSPLKILDYMDRKLFKWLPFLRLWAWQIVIILKNPKKSHLNRSDSKKYVKT